MFNVGLDQASSSDLRSVAEPVESKLFWGAGAVNVNFGSHGSEVRTQRPKIEFFIICPFSVPDTVESTRICRIRDHKNSTFFNIKNE